MLPRHKQFIKERQYVIRLRECGLEPIYSKSPACYQSVLPCRAKLPVVKPKMKIEQRMLPTFETAHVND